MVVSNYQWIPAEHLLILDDKLLEVAAGRIKRLLITLPPRHGKSEFTSQYFPVWFLGRFPYKRIILASYESDFASEWGMKARDLMTEWGPRLFGVELRKDSRSRKSWKIKGHRGGMQTAGVRGPLTGKGMDLGIIDDPIKNDEDAQSKALRDKMWDWYRSTFYTRLEPDAAIIVIQTRWHEDDLAGRLLREMSLGGEQWAVLNIPALAEKDDLLGRKKGEALWPERYSVERLNKIKEAVGSRWFAALYQQKPAPDEGNIFLRRWWKKYKERPHADAFCKIIQSWDLAFKDLDTSAYVVGQVWGLSSGKYDLTPNSAYLLDQTRSKLNGPDSVRAIMALTDKWPESKKSGIFIEDKANGPTVIATLKEKGVSGVIGVKVPQGAGKEARASAASIFVEAGDVWIPDENIFGGWVQDFIEEHASFPNSEYADQVDATSQALDKLLAVKTGGKITTVRKGVVC